MFLATFQSRLACNLFPTAAVFAIWFLGFWWLVPFRDTASPMQNEACTVLFKYTHVGSGRQDEWLVLCPDSRVIFARKTRGGRRAFGSVGSWRPTSSGFDLVAWACCLGAKRRDLSFHRIQNKIHQWESQADGVTRRVLLMGWTAPPIPQLCDMTQRPDPNLLAIADTDQVADEASYRLASTANGIDVAVTRLARAPKVPMGIDVALTRLAPFGSLLLTTREAWT